ncbi:MAG: DUF2158 domain-containing protein [Candidatus Sulfotelmatobacter sp.]
MATWKIGDLVRLKSGGPKMTVNALRGAMAHIVGCSWFVENDLKEADFSHDALEQWQEADSK